MKLKYSKDVDILMMELSDDPIAFAEKKDNIIVHFNKFRQPVALEIMDAKEILNRAYHTLPQKIERRMITV